MAIKLVIVDDAPFIREVIRNLAEEVSIEVVGEASEGKEAIEVVRSTRPDIVFMDVVMPHMNGVDSTYAICKEFPEIKVIACSTLDEPMVLDRMEEAGCHSYLLKPFSKKDLLDAIHKAMEER